MTAVTSPLSGRVLGCASARFQYPLLPPIPAVRVSRVVTADARQRAALERIRDTLALYPAALSPATADD